MEFASSFNLPIVFKQLISSGSTSKVRFWKSQWRKGEVRLKKKNGRVERCTFGGPSKALVEYSLALSTKLQMSLRTVLLPAPIPPPMRRSTGLRSLWSTGAITSVH